MITENLSTLKIHKLTQGQYDRELAAGNIDENAIYLTPDDNNNNNVITEYDIEKTYEEQQVYSANAVNGLFEALKAEIQGDLDEISDLVGGEETGKVIFNETLTFAFNEDLDTTCDTTHTLPKLENGKFYLVTFNGVTEYYQCAVGDYTYLGDITRTNTLLFVNFSYEYPHVIACMNDENGTFLEGEYTLVIKEIQEDSRQYVAGMTEDSRLYLTCAIDENGNGASDIAEGVRTTVELINSNSEVIASFTREDFENAQYSYTFDSDIYSLMSEGEEYTVKFTMTDYSNDTQSYFECGTVSFTDTAELIDIKESVWDSGSIVGYEEKKALCIGNPFLLKLQAAN